MLVGLILGAASASQPAGELHDDQYAAAVAYAETRLRSGIDLRDWAAAAGMAAPDFTRRFRRRTGTAPYAWFMDRRIDAAMHLLGTTDQPILDIALELGFSSQSHFTDAFKHRTGVAPGRWRAACRATTAR